MAALERSLQLQNARGLHARPIAQVVELAQSHRAQLTASHAGREADARSILELMSLGAGPKAEVRFVAEGEDAAALLDALQSLFERRFGEP